MALSPQFLDELRARTPMQAIVARRVKLSKAGRNWTGCCPFHAEKTPSFHVYADHFHCFGCGAHGDALSFMRRSEGVSFTEAVERLAGKAGLGLPEGWRGRPSRPLSLEERDRRERLLRAAAADRARRAAQDTAFEAGQHAKARDLLAASQPISGTPAELYLTSTRAVPSPPEG